MKKDKSRKLTSDEQNFILALYKIEYENLCKYADKMMKGSLAAEDLVQDTLIIACRKIDELIMAIWLKPKNMKYLKNLQLMVIHTKK